MGNIFHLISLRPIKNFNPPKKSFFWSSLSLEIWSTPPPPLGLISHTYLTLANGEIEYILNDTLLVRSYCQHWQWKTGRQNCLNLEFVREILLILSWLITKCFATPLPSPLSPHNMIWNNLWIIMFDMSFSSRSFYQQLRIKIVDSKTHLHAQVTCSMSERFGDIHFNKI